MRFSNLGFSIAVVSFQFQLIACPGDTTGSDDSGADIGFDGVFDMTEPDSVADVALLDVSDVAPDTISDRDSSFEDLQPTDSVGDLDSVEISPDTNDTEPDELYQGGFGEVVRWAVPDAGFAGGFHASFIVLDQRAWDLRDLNGDQLPDLVQTADPTQDLRQVFWDDDGPHWRVFLAEGHGFQESFIRWAVPENGLYDGFSLTESDTEDRVWSLLEMTGDDRPDLVHTMDSVSDATFTDDSGAYWRVFVNQGNGFADGPLRWPVPDPGTADGFYATQLALGPACFDTMDLNGDDLPDLVQTCLWHDEGELEQWAVLSDDGGDYWLVYLNTGVGFEGSGQRWPVPLREEALGSPPQRGFLFTSGHASWTTADLDGDGLRDLVHASLLENGFVFNDDGPYWRVYRNIGNGFATDFTRWPVPDNGLEDGFFAPIFQVDDRVWTLLDLTGDDRLDLVQTVDPEQMGIVPFASDDGFHWRLYPNTSDGFGPSEPWELPDSGYQNTYATWNSFDAPNDRYWVTVEIDGDGLPDFVQTCAPPLDVTRDVFTDQSGDYWNVYLGQRERVD